jgi:hypothetical protein
MTGNWGLCPSFHTSFHISRSDPVNIVDISEVSKSFRNNVLEHGEIWKK